jgi:3-hydroxy-3-methylglutaryl CoA synthase/uncharacterized OB-fold protein
MGWLTSNAGSGKGTRTLAFWDEDSLTMAVAAARQALGDRKRDPANLHFASTTPPYAEPQNASIAHAALRLPAECLTQDVTGSPRAGLIALQAALEGGTSALIAAGDVATAAPGSIAESRNGDGGAAVLTGTGPGLFRYLGGANLSAPFIERYRVNGNDQAMDWEERWVREQGFLGLLPGVIGRALAAAGRAPEDIKHLVLPCAIPGVVAAVAERSGLTVAVPAPSLNESCGDTGAAHGLLMLAQACEKIRPGDLVLLAQFGQGATVLVLEAEAGLARLASLVSSQLAGGIAEDNYLKLLAFRNRMDWDRGLRGRFIVNEALSTAWRYSDALLGFVGGRCTQTGRVQFPPSRIAVGAGMNVDTQEPWPLADRGGIVATFTSDLLAFSPHPPNSYGLVDINGGGRLQMEFTDPEASAVRPETPVDFVFRIKDIDPRSGYRRYFWKAVARPSGA